MLSKIVQARRDRQAHPAICSLFDIDLLTKVIHTCQVTVAYNNVDASLGPIDRWLLMRRVEVFDVTKLLLNLRLGNKTKPRATSWLRNAISFLLNDGRGRLVCINLSI